jgi:alpha-beta hydrolase superfamily lysophospholipase
MRKGIIVLGLIGLFAGLTACWFAGSFLVAPSLSSVGTPPPDLPAEAVSWKTSDGRRIKGWFVDGKKGQGAVVLLHRLRGNRRSMLGRARFLHRAGYAVLLYDFQAHGESPGDFMTFGHLESKDAESAVRYIKRRLPGEKIGAMGVSLGGAAALLGRTASSVDALVLEAVFTNLVEAVENRLAYHMAAPARYLSPLLLWQVEPRLGIDPKDLSPIDRIGSANAPILMIAGGDDRRATLEQSRRLFARAPRPKTLWVIEGAGHENFHRLAGSEYERRVLAFFQQYLR